MFSQNKIFRENLILLIVAHMFWLAQPAIVSAQGGDYNPLSFTQPLKVARGTVVPIGSNAMYLNDEDCCRLLIKDYGWKSCTGIDAVLLGMGDDIDTLLVGAPVSDGYVSLDDWDSAAGQEVESITKAYKQSMVEQSAALGYPVEFIGWSLYPQVDHSRKVLYFANTIKWNGEDTLNITIVKFDRYGYTIFKVVPASSVYNGAQIAALVDDVVSSYKPKAGSSYTEFTSGDKVAGYGALGAFAGVLGIKYGKGIASGLLALIPLLLKKFWLLFLPLIWVVTLLTKRFSPTKVGERPPQGDS